MAGEKVTIRDIAQKAGVSVSTVSRVITCSGRVNSKTRAHIENLMKELGYKPNMAAQSLKTQRTRNIFSSPGYCKSFLLKYCKNITKVCV